MAKGAAVVSVAAARWALGAVFVYAGALKAAAPDDFAWAVYNYRVLPYPAAAAVALYLPWLEIACGLGVLWPRARLGALSLLLGLCVVFAVALTSAWWRQLDIACGCFGSGHAGAASLRFSLARAVLLGLGSGWLLWREVPRDEPAVKPGGLPGGKG